MSVGYRWIYRILGTVCVEKPNSIIIIRHGILLTQKIFITVFQPKAATVAPRSSSPISGPVTIAPECPSSSSSSSDSVSEDTKSEEKQSKPGDAGSTTVR